MGLRGKGVRRHAPLPRAELIDALLEAARAMLYRGDAGETFCLAVAEAQALGVPAVVQALGARGRARDRRRDRHHRRATTRASPRAAIALLADDALWRRQHEAALARQKGSSWDDVAAALRGARRMTRLLQAMAGQAHGGAEAFFERLAVALQRAGREQRLVIRRDAARAARARAAPAAR